MPGHAPWFRAVAASRETRGRITSPPAVPGAGTRPPGRRGNISAVRRGFGALRQLAKVVTLTSGACVGACGHRRPWLWDVVEHMCALDLQGLSALLPVGSGGRHEIAMVWHGSCNNQWRSHLTSRLTLCPGPGTAPRPIGDRHMSMSSVVHRRKPPVALVTFRLVDDLWRQRHAGAGVARAGSRCRALTRARYRQPRHRGCPRSRNASARRRRTRTMPRASSSSRRGEVVGILADNVASGGVAGRRYRAGAERGQREEFEVYPGRVASRDGQLLILVDLNKLLTDAGGRRWRACSRGGYAWRRYDILLPPTAMQAAAAARPAGRGSASRDRAGRKAAQHEDAHEDGPGHVDEYA